MAGTTDTKLPIHKQILVGFAITLVAAGFAHTVATRKANDDEDRVVISVTFKPADRKEPVFVRAIVAGVEILNEMMTHSPGNWQVDVPKGAQVMVNANQNQNGDLDCILQVNGEVVDTNHRNNPGSIRCWHNRK